MEIISICDYAENLHVGLYLYVCEQISDKLFVMILSNSVLYQSVTLTQAFFKDTGAHSAPMCHTFVIAKFNVMRGACLLRVIHTLSFCSTLFMEDDQSYLDDVTHNHLTDFTLTWIQTYKYMNQFLSSTPELCEYSRCLKRMWHEVQMFCMQNTGSFFFLFF